MWQINPPAFPVFRVFRERVLSSLCNKFVICPLCREKLRERHARSVIKTNTPSLKADVPSFSLHEEDLLPSEVKAADFCFDVRFHVLVFYGLFVLDLIRFYRSFDLAQAVFRVIFQEDCNSFVFRHLRGKIFAG